MASCHGDPKRSVVRQICLNESESGAAVGGVRCRGFEHVLEFAADVPGFGKQNGAASDNLFRFQAVTAQADDSRGMGTFHG